ncbi:leucine-rich repeat domain-containing protein [Metamycoplasma gateae]|uniref:Leucine-rich repeat domain-containing protein n=1 Tax=Metamycoplasma gateae TaxID=35769 RepID=A0ABZ2AMA8_9BACT|nr:leucine-rich repeat domain-containing protein [Metamycoplasma gateae]
MKRNKRILLTLASTIVPVSTAAIVVSCGSGESYNEYAKDFVLGTAGRENYNKETKTLDLSKTEIRFIPQGAFSAPALYALFVKGSAAANPNPQFLAPDGIFDIKKRSINIDKIILPASLEVIEKGAFSDLGLKEVQFDISSDKLTKIDAEAFANNRISTLTLPTSIKEIEEKAFLNNQLTSVNLEALTNLKKLSVGVFAKNKLTELNLTNINTIEESALALNEFKNLELHKDLSRVSEKTFFFIGTVTVEPVSLSVLNASVKEFLKQQLVNNDKLNYSIVE